MIQHCFHYTSTVLTSTLAFQKEQKLKCECQVSDLLGATLGKGSPSSQPQSIIHKGKAHVFLDPWQEGYLVPWRLLKEGCRWVLRTAPLAAGTVCDRPLVFNLGTTATSGQLEQW